MSLVSMELGTETGSRGPSPRSKLKLELSILEGKGDLKLTTNKKQVRKERLSFLTGVMRKESSRQR